MVSVVPKIITVVWRVRSYMHIIHMLVVCQDYIIAHQIRRLLGDLVMNLLWLCMSHDVKRARETSLTNRWISAARAQRSVKATYWCVQFGSRPSFRETCCFYIFFLGIPETDELANTYYQQFEDEFDSEDSETEMIKNLESCLQDLPRKRSFSRCWSVTREMFVCWTEK